MARAAPTPSARAADAGRIGGLTRAQRLVRAQARDASCNGRFLTGVLTTGIYCLPSCPARPANPDNIVHFATPQDARAAGLRACLRCRPDDFYRGYDPDEEDAAVVAREVVAAPADFADARAIAARTGVGVTKLHTLFRRHLHRTPAAFLAQARVQFACERLRAGDRVLDAALAAGFDSQSAFYANFTPRVGMTPDAYRRLPRAAQFGVALPDDFRRAELLAFLARDTQGLSERVAGDIVHKAVDLDGAPAVLQLEFAGSQLRCAVLGAARTSARMFAAHAMVVRLLHLALDPGEFETRARRSPLWRVVRTRPGLRIPCTATPFEALVWTVVGQQVNVEFAATLRARVIARCGARVGDMWAHPTPAQLAGVDAAEWRPMQFSQRKGEYLQQLAAACAKGELAIAPDLAEPASRLQRRLVAQRGLGAWSASYTLLRGFGFADCAPVGDVGLQRALQLAFELPERPEEAVAERLLAPFSPWRSLATYHLWASLADAPPAAAKARPRVSRVVSRGARAAPASSRS